MRPFLLICLTFFPLFASEYLVTYSTKVTLELDGNRCHNRKTNDYFIIKMKDGKNGTFHPIPSEDPVEFNLSDLSKLPKRRLQGYFRAVNWDTTMHIPPRAITSFNDIEWAQVTIKPKSKSAHLVGSRFHPKQFLRNRIHPEPTSIELLKHTRTITATSNTEDRLQTHVREQDTFKLKLTVDGKIMDATITVLEVIDSLQ